MEIKPVQQKKSELFAKLAGLGVAAAVLVVPTDASGMDMYNGFRGPILGPNVTQQIKMRKNMADKVA